MGKQINYWLGYEDFLKIAQAALECGCVIIKNASGTRMYGQTLDFVTEHEHYYWFYVPEAGTYRGKRPLLMARRFELIHPLEILL